MRPISIDCHKPSSDWRASDWDNRHLSIPYMSVARIYSISEATELFSVRFDDPFRIGEFLTRIHSYYSANPVGEPFSPTRNVKPLENVKVGCFAAAYIQGIHEVCRVKVVCVNGIYVDVLIIDIGFVQTVRIDSLMTLPIGFTNFEYSKAMVLTCRLPGRSSLRESMYRFEELKIGLKVNLYVLSSDEPCLAVCRTVSNLSARIELSLVLKMGDDLNFNSVDFENEFTVIDRHDNERRMHYPKIPQAPSDGPFLATVVNVENVNAIHLRDIYSGLRLANLHEAIQMRYEDLDFRNKMYLKLPEMVPRMAVVFCIHLTFYRGTIISTNYDSENLCIEAVDYPGTIVHLPVNFVYHPTPEIVKVPPLLYNFELNPRLTQAQMYDKNNLLLKVLDRDWVVTARPDTKNLAATITMPGGRDLCEAIGLSQIRTVRKLRRRSL